MVLTNEERCRRHLTTEIGCAECKDQPETLLHLFRDCPLIYEVWCFWLDLNSNTEFFNVPFAEWLRSNIMTDKRLPNGLKWASVFANTIWWAWRWRNNKVFNDGGKRPNKPNFIESITKANADGAVSNDGISAAGGAIRDPNGVWAGGFCHRIGSCPVVMAEIWGIIGCLQVAWKLGYRRIEVETDSQLALALVTQGVPDCHPSVSLVKHCQGWLKRNWEVKFHHVYREANRVADSLAKASLALPRGYHKLLEPPEGIGKLLEEDNRGWTTPRIVSK